MLVTRTQVKIKDFKILFPKHYHMIFIKMATLPKMSQAGNTFFQLWSSQQFD